MTLGHWVSRGCDQRVRIVLCLGGGYSTTLLTLLTNSPGMFPAFLFTLGTTVSTRKKTPNPSTAELNVICLPPHVPPLYTSGHLKGDPFCCFSGTLTVLMFVPHLPGEGCWILSEFMSSPLPSPFSAPPRLQVPDRSGHFTGPNSKRQIAVGALQPLAPDHSGDSGHCRTSTASSRSQWAVLDLNGQSQIENARIYARQNARMHAR